MIEGQTMEYVKCNICALEDTKFLLKIEKANIVKCKNCGLVYVNPRPTKKELSKLYQKDYYTNKRFFEGKYYGYHDYKKNVEGTIKTFELVQKTIKKFKEKGKLLDIGCGPGVYLGVAEKDGFKVQGIEISKEGFEKSKSKFKVINKPLEDANIKGKFDVVTLFDVIEHLPTPKSTLLNINRIMNKNSLLCIITPDVDSLAARFLGSRWPEFRRWREHIYFFSRKTMQRLLESTGFELIETWTIGKYFTLEDFINETKIFNAKFSDKILNIIKFLKLSNLWIYVNPYYKRVFFARKINP